MLHRELMKMKSTIKDLEQDLKISKEKLQQALFFRALSIFQLTIK
jgi:predicted ATPase with chaperone activity